MVRITEGTGIIEPAILGLVCFGEQYCVNVNVKDR